MYSDEVSMEHWWNDTDRAKPEYQEKKRVSTPFCLPQILLGLV
jgi:hypothetical protein